MKKNLLINAGIVMVAVAGGVALSIKPWRVYQEQKKAALEQVAEMKTSEEKREKLVRQDAQLKTSVGREELAREKGYLKPGEVPAPK